MKKIHKALLIFLSFFLIFQFCLVFSESAARAQSLWEMQHGLQGDNSIGEDAYGEGGLRPERDIREILAYYLKIFLGFLGLIFVIIILSAGFKWMTAAGNKEKIEEAMSQLKAGAIGLGIILASYAIAKFVICVVIEVTTERICIF